MSEEIKVGQRMYLADLREILDSRGNPTIEVEVIAGTVAEVDRTLMLVVYGDGDKCEWTAKLSAFCSPWQSTRRAALARLRDETMSGVERHEEALRISREDLALVEAALSAEVGDE